MIKDLILLQIFAFIQIHKHLINTLEKIFNDDFYISKVFLFQ